MSPDGPGNEGEFGMTAQSAQIFERLLERGIRSIARIAPQVTVLLVRLFIRGREQGAVVLFASKQSSRIRPAMKNIILVLSVLLYAAHLACVRSPFTSINFPPSD